MKKTIVASIVAFMLSVTAFSQTVVERNERPKKVYNGPTGHALGAVLSSTNGKGLSYRYWPRDFGFHVSFFPAANGLNKFYNGGVTGYMTLKEYEVGKLFLHAGVEYQYSSQTRNGYSGYPYYQTLEYTDKTIGYNIGFGPGLHILQKFVSMDIFLGYGAYVRERTTTDPFRKVRNETIMTLTGGIAFYLEL